MGNLRLIQLLESLLGKAKVNQSSGEVGFHCPFCKHYKKKFNINLNTEKWQCWVCGVGGYNILSLLKKIKPAIKYFKDYYSITGTSHKKHIGSKKYDELSLPESFEFLSESNARDPEVKNVLVYLKKRGITSKDILKYRIGYCESGKYGGMIIVPSYDENGNLNFFTGRSYYKDSYITHLNPKASKDIIGFDLLINWSEPITIVEGAFDAIAVKRNSIPLFGKLILGKLKLKIMEKGVKEINIALDSDARNNAIKMAEYFMNNGINVNLVEIIDKDPSELGFYNITRLIKETDELTFSKVMEYKLYEN